MAAEINETPASYLVTRAQNRAPHLFQPGNSANPGGKPAGLMRLARQLTDDGAEIVHFYLRVLRGQRLPRLSDDGKRVLPFLKGRGDIPNIRQRIEAASWLADRGWGKVVQTTELRSDQPVTLITLKWGDEGVGGSIEVGEPTSVEQEGEGGHDPE